MPGSSRTEFFSFDAPPGAAGKADQGGGAVHGQDVGAGEVPHVFTDQDAHAAELAVKGAEPLSPGQVALLVEQAVGGEIDLAVDVDDPALLQVEGGVVEPVVVGHFHQADGDGDVAGQLLQSRHLGGVEP